MATLTLVDVDKPDDRIVFTSPMRTLELKGANAVQLLGGVETYQRRYLYMAVLDIVENDRFDGMTPTPKKQQTQEPKSSAFVDEVVAIVSALPQSERKNAGEIIKKQNGGAAAWRDVTDPVIQANIIKALKETYHV